MYFSFKLDENFCRPVIRAQQPNAMRIMLDTGALFSVWTIGEERLKRLGGIDQKHVVPFGGFGGRTRGKLFTMDVWLKETFLLKNLPVVINNGLEVNCPLILSSTAFDRFDYSRSARVGTFEVDTKINQVAYSYAYRIKPNGSIRVYMQDE